MTLPSQAFNAGEAAPILGRVASADDGSRGRRERVEQMATASPLAEPLLRLNVVCPYYTMFPLSFPLRVLAGAREGGAVLDPFCGRGTTSYAARLIGLRSVGVDADEVAVAVARAKLVSRTAAQVLTRLDELLGAVESPSDVPEGEFWHLAFERETLWEICRLREALMNQDSDDDVLLRAITLGILHGPQSVRELNYLSNQMPRTYATKPRAAVKFWLRIGSTPRRVPIRAAVRRRATYLLAGAPSPTGGRIIHGDSRGISEMGITETFDHVVTSPPYLGMRTYRPDQWLRHWFLGAPPEVDYSTAAMIPPSVDTFARELGRVWRGAAGLVIAGGSMAVRFGVLPSVKGDAEGTLRTSLAGTGWEVQSIRSAGSAASGKRQANHMRRTSVAVDEIDLYARLVR